MAVISFFPTQNLNEFELHLRAVLGLPIPGIKQERIGASAVIPVSYTHLDVYKRQVEYDAGSGSSRRKFLVPGIQNQLALGLSGRAESVSYTHLQHRSG